MGSFDSIEDAFKKLKSSDKKYWASYAGFYSSYLGGYFREPWAMTVPLDDHGFHRGDGVFEAVRIHKRAYFDLDAHIERLLKSADSIGLTPFGQPGDIKKIVVELARRCELEAGILRLYMTRGPGGFSPNPEECVRTELYAALTLMKPANPERYSKGVSAFFSQVLAKDPWFSQIKSLNYLPNVLMRRECASRGLDFAISVNGSGVLCEGATENLFILTKGRDLIVPRFDYTLRGTTVRQVMALAENLKSRLNIKSVRFGDLTKGDLTGAEEAAFVGTTLGVLPISSLDGHPLGSGRGGPTALALNEALMEKMSTDQGVRTSF